MSALVQLFQLYKTVIFCCHVIKIKIKYEIAGVLVLNIPPPMQEVDIGLHMPYLCKTIHQFKINPFSGTRDFALSVHIVKKVPQKRN